MNGNRIFDKPLTARFRPSQARASKGPTGLRDESLDEGRGLNAR